MIDDDREVLASIAFLLPMLGYECAAFAGPEEFLGQCDRLAPGCVLTDLRMPVIDGFALASRIRDGLGWPVVMMTSDADRDVERRAAEHDVCAVLHKPVDAEVLADALDRAFTGLDG